MLKHRNTETQKHNKNNNIYRVFCCFALALFIAKFFVSSVYAGELAIIGKVDKTEITVEDSILLSITVSGVQSPPTPELPDLPDFTVQPGGTVSQVQFVNGKLSSDTIFNYALIPRRAGTFTIGPAIVEVRGKIARSEPIQVKVTPVAKKAGKRPDVFIEHSVSTKNPYKNQQIIYTFRYYSIYSTAQAKLEEPDFEGFIFEKLGDEREYNKKVGDNTYRVIEIRKALFPARTGAVTIGEAKLAAEVVVPSRRRRGSRDQFFRSFFDDSFFGIGGQRQTKHLRTDPIDLEVRELPLAGRPKDFGGLVGNVGVVTKVEKQQLAVGDSSTIHVTISGNANLQNVELPPLAGVKDFKTYDDRPEFTQKIKGDQLYGVKTFKRALVPMKPGEFRIPPVSLSYFNPDSGQYEVAQDEWITLSIRPSEEAEEFSLVRSAVPAGGTQVKILGQDILPPHNRLRQLTHQHVSRGGILTGVLLFLPFFGFLVTLVVYNRIESDRKDTAGVRRRKAFGRSRAELKRLRADVQGENAELFRNLSRVIREYLGDRFDMPGAALTPVEAERLLREEPDRAGKISPRVREILEKLEGYRFGVDLPSREERQVLYREVRKLIGEMEKILKKPVSETGGRETCP